jgi:hypothetical protein
VFKDINSIFSTYFILHAVCLSLKMVGKRLNVVLFSLVSFTGYFFYSVSPRNDAFTVTSKPDNLILQSPLSSAQDLSRVKRFVWRNIIGGLGNQLFEYAAGYSLARKHGIPFMIQLPPHFFHKSANQSTSSNYVNGEFILHHFRIQIPRETEYLEQLNLVQRLNNASQVFPMNDDAILAQVYTVRHLAHLTNVDFL